MSGEFKQSMSEDALIQMALDTALRAAATPEPSPEDKRVLAEMKNMIDDIREMPDVDVPEHLDRSILAIPRKGVSPQDFLPGINVVHLLRNPFLMALAIIFMIVLLYSFIVFVL